MFVLFFKSLSWSELQFLFSVVFESVEIQSTSFDQEAWDCSAEKKIVHHLHKIFRAKSVLIWLQFYMNSFSLSLSLSLSHHCSLGFYMNYSLLWLQQQHVEQNALKHGETTSVPDLHVHNDDNALRSAKLYNNSQLLGNRLQCLKVLMVSIWIYIPNEIMILLGTCAPLVLWGFPSHMWQCWAIFVLVVEIFSLQLHWSSLALFVDWSHIVSAYQMCCDQ